MARRCWVPGKPASPPRRQGRRVVFIRARRGGGGGRPVSLRGSSADGVLSCSGVVPEVGGCRADVNVTRHGVIWERGRCFSERDLVTVRSEGGYLVEVSLWETRRPRRREMRLRMVRIEQGDGLELEVSILLSEWGGRG